MTKLTENNSLLLASIEFYRQVNSLNDVARTIRDRARFCKAKGWQNVSLTPEAAEACIELNEESAMEIVAFVEGMKQALILSEKNRIIAESILIYPVRQAIEDYYNGKVDSSVPQAALNRFVGKNNASHE